MRKIAILTFHRACNFGAFLQAYALQEALNQYPDINAYILDYRSTAIEEKYREVSFFNKKGNLFKNICKFILDYKFLCKRNTVFDEILADFFQMEEHNLTKHQLTMQVQKYDAFVVGSDQVWNCSITNDDEAFFLDFVKQSEKKYSYAASLGKCSLADQELLKLTTLISDFKRVSVRESDIASRLNQFLDVPRVIFTLDPVFLFGAEWWRSFYKYEKRKPYVLFFMMGRDTSSLYALDFAKCFAQSNNLDIVYLSDYDRWYKFRDMSHFGVASPLEFIGLIDNAELVVTNSFHATAFSIILHKYFYVETDIPHSSRILNLLEIAGLEQRGLVKGERKQLNECIEWENVERKLHPFIDMSHKYIDTIISDLDRRNI